MAANPVRLAVYTDYAYHRVGDEVYAERAFALFLGALRRRVDRLVLVGRLSAEGATARYPVGEGVELVALPFYSSLSRPFRVLPSLLRSLRIFWRSLPGVDCVWLLGPHPLAVAFAVLAAARGKRVVLGVRQDMPAYVRSRHPGRPALRAAALLLEGAFRALGRLFGVIAVGPELAANYRRSRDVLEITVSLVGKSDLVEPEVALRRPYAGELQVLAVGRLEAEKNPLLLADVLTLLNREEARWRLVVCGEGDLSEELEAGLARLGQSDRAELRGYVPFGEELRRLYRDSHAFLHTSWTEGLPQVLPEAFAAGLPVIATDVGGIGEAVGDAALMVPCGDADAASRALRSVAGDPQLRERLVRAGNEYVNSRTIEAETERVGTFLRDAR